MVNPLMHKPTAHASVNYLQLFGLCLLFPVAVPGDAL